MWAESKAIGQDREADCLARYPPRSKVGAPDRVAEILWGLKRGSSSVAVDFGISIP